MVSIAGQFFSVEHERVRYIILHILSFYIQTNSSKGQFGIH